MNVLSFRSLPIAFLTLTTMVLSGCGSEKTSTSSFLDATHVGALVATDDGGLLYGDYETGEVWAVDMAGNRDSEPLAALRVTPGPTAGVLGLTQDDEQRTFASFVSSDGRLSVARLEGGQATIIWNGPNIGVGHAIGGALAITQHGRVLATTGDLGDPETVDDANALNGKLLTLDPDGATDQRPNAVAAGFSNPTAITYDQGGALWVADISGTDALLFRVGNNGDRSDPTTIAKSGLVTGMTNYSEQELVLCFAGTNKLQRFLINDATRAVPGRELASDCGNELARLKDGRLVYSTGTELRVTN